MSVVQTIAEVDADAWSADGARAEIVATLPDELWSGACRVERFVCEDTVHIATIASLVTTDPHPSLCMTADAVVLGP
jgi:hypothetical protein